jgi:hypothetical protein
MKDNNINVMFGNFRLGVVLGYVIESRAADFLGALERCNYEGEENELDGSCVCACDVASMPLFLQVFLLGPSHNRKSFIKASSSSSNGFQFD